MVVLARDDNGDSIPHGQFPNQRMGMVANVAPREPNGGKLIPLGSNGGRDDPLPVVLHSPRGLKQLGPVLFICANCLEAWLAQHRSWRNTYKICNPNQAALSNPFNSASHSQSLHLLRLPTAARTTAPAVPDGTTFCSPYQQSSCIHPQIHYLHLHSRICSCQSARH